MSKFSCLPPIVDDQSEVLILGTIPGTESHVKKEYYANQDNIFWEIMYRIYNPPIAVDEELILTYTQKLSLLTYNKIALWDVLSSCLREGNRDNKITGEKVNDFVDFFETYKNIKVIIFNGDRAFRYFKNAYPNLLKVKAIKNLYSTSCSSPINAFYILYKWSVIKELTN